jgi:PAS domain S-box-containing protein
MSMSSVNLSELVSRDQFAPLVMALARLAGLPVQLLDGDGSLLASSPGPSGSDGGAKLPPEIGIHTLTLPIEVAGAQAAALVLGPFRSADGCRPPVSRRTDRIPVLSGLRVEVVQARARTIAQLLAEMGFSGLELRRERAERGKAEEALLTRETQYRSLVEQMNEGLLAGDRSTRITYVNARMAAMLGYSEAELLGRPFYEFMDPGVRASYLARIERRHVGVSEKYETELLHKDGRKISTLISAAPLRDSLDTVIGSFAVISDITEQKVSEKTLRESEEKFRILFETMQDVFYRGDENGRLVLMSPSGARLLGYSSTEDLIGCDIAETMYLNPSDRNVFLAAIQERGVVRDFEVTLRKQDGTAVVVSTNSRLNYDERGCFSGIEGAFFDITERKKAEEALRQSEERYRLIVNNVQDIIFTHLPDGTISFVSGSIRHLGYIPEEGVGHNLFEFVHPDDIKVARDAFLQTLRTQEGTGIEIRVRCKNGEYVWMEEQSDPVLLDGQLSQVTCVLRDISKRKSAEEALRLSENKYGWIINNIRDLVYSYSQDGVISFVSESVRRMGYETQEIVGRSLFDFLHPDDVAASQKAVGRAIRERLFDPVECRLRNKNGAYVWFEANSEPMLVSGELLQINGVAREITDRKRAEIALRESEEKYRWLLEQLSEGILVSDLDDVITFANPRMAEMLGYTVEELIGQKDTILMVEEDMADYRERAKRRSPGTSGQYEVQLIKKNGAPVHVLVSGTPLKNPDGAWVGTFGVLSDITEWKRAQEELKRLSTAIEQTSDSIIITDTRGRILYANPASQTLTGLTLAELIGNNLDVLRSGKQTESFYHEILDTVRKGETWSGHLVNVRADGTRYETNTTMSPVRDTEGCIKYVVTSSRDITREAELEVQLRHSQRMEAIGVMAGGIAHDFNNILTPVMGYTEMALNRQGLDAKVSDYLKEIASAGQRASELVQQILTFSRQTEQVKQPVQVDSIIKESLKLLRAGIPSTIAIRQRIGGMGTQALADASQIHQVVMNLCTNAFHAMREKGGVLEVVLDVVSLASPLVLLGSTLPAGEYLRLRVSDSGRGMDEATQKKIFLPFFTTKRAGEGTGLGLSIVHGIVVGMGGSINVESEVGRGTTFTLYFPSVHESPKETTAAIPAAPKGSERILVVDDEVIIGAMLQDALTFSGYEVEIAEFPLLALELLRKEPERFDLVITDLMMPELTGVDLARKIWELQPGLPIILMTGYTEDLEEDSAKEMGFEILLRKPVSLSVIGQSVRAVLDRKPT